MFTSLRNRFMSGSIPYIFMPLVFMIPAPSKYSSFEKLTKPFNINVWIPLTSLTLFSIMAVLLFKLYPEKFKKLRSSVLGAYNQNPLLNMYAILFGESLHILPTRSFARFLMISLVLFCLVIRTLYQGELFINMQSDILKSSVSSVIDMLERDFHFYITPNTIVFTNGTIIDSRLIKFFINLNINKSIIILMFYRTIVISKDVMDKYIKHLDNPRFKGAVAINLDDVIIMNKKTFPKHMIEICKEYIFVNPLGIYFQKNSHLVDEADNVIKAYQTNGMIALWEKNLIDTKFLIRPLPTKKAQILDLNQLMGGFLIFLLGLWISFIVFVMEYVSLKFGLLKKYLTWIHKTYKE